MKKLGLVITCLFCSGILFAQFNHQWAYDADNLQYQGTTCRTFATTVDAFGNTYISGEFQKTIDFDHTAGTSYLIANNIDGFITKYDINGNLQYAHKISGPSTDQVTAITSDADGNIFVGGHFYNSTDFDPSNNEFMVVNPGVRMFFAKYDSAGNFISTWILEGTLDQTGITDIKLDNDGNIIICGSFNNIVDFDPGPGVVNRTSNGQLDAFMAKYDSAGNLLFVHTFGATNTDLCRSISIDTANNIYATGYYRGTVDVDPGAGTVNLTGGTSSNMFNLKYDENFTYIYAKAITSSNGIQPLDITIDNSGQVYICGRFWAGVDMDPGAGTAFLSNPSSAFADGFFVKYDNAGNYVFAKRIGGTGSTDDEAHGIALDDSLNIYVGGNFTATVDFNPGAGVYNLVAPAGALNLFLGKYDNSGNFIFAGEIGDPATSFNEVAGVHIGPTDKVHLAGHFNNTADLDMGAGTDVETNTHVNPFVALYQPGGSFIWGLTPDNGISPSQNESARSTFKDQAGNVYITGGFAGTLDIDHGPGTTNLISAGLDDIFVAKYNDAGNLLFGFSIGGTGTDLGKAIRVDNAGNIWVTGGFSTTADFNPGAPITNLTSAGNTDIFIAKYDASGNYIFAGRMGSSTPDIGNDIDIDNLDAIFITGNFQGAVDFDPGAGTANLVSGSAASEVFFAKYNSAGNYLFAKSLTGASPDFGNGIDVDNSGNIIITGAFQSIVDFDPGPASITMNAGSSTDIFLAKYGPTGLYMFAYKFGVTSNDAGNSVTTDSVGNIYTTGEYYLTADFDPGAGTATLNAIGLRDAYLASYTPAGIFRFATNIGGGSDDIGYDVVVNSQGNAFVTGLFNGTCDFGPSGGTDNLTSYGGADVFLCKYDTIGDWMGGIHMGGFTDDIGYSVAISGNKINVAGSFTLEADFDPGAGFNVLQSLNATDMFIAQYMECTSSIAPDAPTIAADDNLVCATDPVTLSVTFGNLNDASDWYWYSGSCGGTFLGIGTSIVVNPGVNTTYYARGEGACVSPGACGASITVNVIPSTSSSTSASACVSYTWPLNGNTYLSSGAYNVTIPNAAGCDSVITLNLTINNNTSSSQTTTACTSYTWPVNGNTYISSGVYNTTIPNAHGCDSVITLNLTIHINTSSTQTISSCGSYTWPVNGNTYVSSGVYNTTIPNANGCDSVITLNLTINNNTSSSQTTTACTSYTWSVNGNTYLSSGVYNATIPNINGCDSVITLNLTINNNTSSSQTTTSCVSYTWPVNGNTYFSSGVYNATIPNANGCDSVITLNLTINTNTSSTQTTTACVSYTWPVNGNTYLSSGIYNATILNTNGCDSVITLNLTINTNTSSTQTTTACVSYTWSVNGNTYLSSGVYSATIPNSNGCDSVITLNLTINNNTSSTQTTTSCVSYTWPVNGNTYLSSGTYNATIPNANGCDSVITLNLTINANTSSTQTTTACTSYTWSVNANTYLSSGIYNATIPNANGCDSMITLNLTINTNTSSTQTTTACVSYTWPVNGNTYLSSGVYNATIPNANGCDSVITLNLTINNNTSSTQTTTACTSYTWSVNANTYLSSGIYNATIPNANGCDSVITLNLTINNNTSSTQTTTACTSYTWSVNANTYLSSGIYNTTIPNANGCDSMITLNLTINNNTSSSQTATACTSYTWSVNGNTYLSSGVYNATIPNANGCDSVITLNLTINNNTSSSQSTTSCVSYTWPVNGNTYLSSGVYNATIPNSNGCDSVITLNLTINNNTSSTQTTTSCVSYTWPVNGNTYLSSGTYNATIPNANGCDSVITLNLTINNNTSSTQTTTSCVSYTWPVNGNTYLSSGTYNATIPNANGCDSVITLNLTINNNTSSSQTATACTSYTWSVNGNTYLSSGVYNATIPNANGCDSVITLNLTINNNTSSSQSEIACDNYTWPVNGNAYSSSGIYNATIPNVNGCDSVITLNLTINNSSSSSQSATACNNYTWPVDGNNYSFSGSYNATIPNSVGCDSVITLNLTINNNTSSTINASDCESYLSPSGNYTWTTSGSHPDTIPNSHGCDSIITVVLTIHGLPSVSYNELTTPACVYWAPFTLTAGTPSGGEYSGLGVTTNSFDPSITGMGNQAVIYQFTDGNNCSNSDTSFIQVNGCLGVEDGSNDPIILFPNPNYGNFTVTIPGTETCWMKIYDFTGKLVLTNKLLAGDNPVNLNARCGMYFVHMLNLKNEETIIKLVIQ